MTKAQRIGASLLLTLVAILIPVEASANTNPCPEPTSHVWCGTGYTGDITSHWWGMGLYRIINHGHVPESA